MKKNYKETTRAFPWHRKPNLRDKQEKPIGLRKENNFPPLASLSIHKWSLFSNEVFIPEIKLIQKPIQEDKRPKPLILKKCIHYVTGLALLPQRPTSIPPTTNATTTNPSTFSHQYSSIIPSAMIDRSAIQSHSSKLYVFQVRNVNQLAIAVRDNIGGLLPRPRCRHSFGA